MPTLEALLRAERDTRPLDRARFVDDACELEVGESGSHCALTHLVDGRWLRLRFSLPARTSLSARWADAALRPEPAVAAWSRVGAGASATGGVDVYIALPTTRADLRIASSRWPGAAHTLEIRPGTPTTIRFAEKGPCR